MNKRSIVLAAYPNACIRTYSVQVGEEPRLAYIVTTKCEQFRGSSFDIYMQKGILNSMQLKKKRGMTLQKLWKWR